MNVELILGAVSAIAIATAGITKVVSSLLKTVHEQRDEIKRLNALIQDRDRQTMQALDESRNAHKYVTEQLIQAAQSQRRRR